ncbi:MAG: diguanylate cyclase [Lachnospiraceae bacterium]|nr:diguanylate cyclase [Lachnospiraceae bacterium]
MKLARVTKKGNRSFYIEFLAMTLLPLIVCGVVMIMVCSRSVQLSMTSEAQDNLQNVAISVLAAYDHQYPGDYEARVEGSTAKLYKGGVDISGDFTLVDDIEAKSHLEISLFLYDTRLVTTLKDRDGNRLTMTVASEKLVNEVFKQQMSAFYDNVSIEGVEYYAYYMPVMVKGGTECIGMIGVAKPASDLKDSINRSVMNNLIIMVLAIAVTSVFILRFANTLVTVVKHMLDFMKKLADNKLDTKLDASVSQREDELGEMGRNLNSLQIALRRLIERDVLTGLFNRRSAEKRIDDIEDSGVRYCVAIGDIDHFKKFNDTFGHECGDVVLREVAHLLNEGMNKHEGFVARWGGEEFLLVFVNEDINQTYDALMIIRQALHDKDVEYDGQIHKVTMTFGAAEKTDGVPINHLIRAADDKLYEGKQGGRDRVLI